jgi:putative holliday junction resolvase
MTSSPSKTKRSAGLDIGDKRIGVAISDALNLTAQPVSVVQRVGLKRDIEAIRAALAPYELECLVAGLPLQMDGSEGKQSARTRAFADALGTAMQLKVVYQDERMTSLQSERILIESGVRRDKRKTVIDKLAATLILQAYLDGRRPAEAF